MITTEYAEAVLQRPAEREQMRRVRRRLAPLAWGSFAAGIILWLPIEKLFMTQIGFDAASIGVVAAAYAALVPLLEVPTGVLADRWSRKGVVIIGYAGLGASSLVGGLSHGIGSYLLSALLFSLYVACSSGTSDSIIYDTLLEETGSGRGYEECAGRIKLLASGALLIGAFGGGFLAQLTSPRITYLATIPILAIAIAVVLRLDEPLLHKASERVDVREQLDAVWAVVGRSRPLRPAVLALVLGGALMMIIWEFHQLWLVDAVAPLAVYGPFMAALFLTDGLGGWLASRVTPGRSGTGMILGGAMVTGATLLAAPLPLAVSLVLIPILIGALSMLRIVLCGILHDHVPSNVRASVMSGVSSLTWMLFTPAALVYGAIAA